MVQMKLEFFCLFVDAVKKRRCFANMWGLPAEAMAPLHLHTQYIHDLDPDLTKLSLDFEFVTEEV